MATTMAHQGLMASLALDLAIQGVGWLVSSTLKTEKLFDLLGTGSFLALSVQGTQFAAAKKNPKAKLLAGMVGTWAVRLGTFLVARVFRTGGDSRFDDAKKNPLKFLVYWSMQGVWVFVTALPLLLVQTQGVKSGWTFTDALGECTGDRDVSQNWHATLYRRCNRLYFQHRKAEKLQRVWHT